MINYIINLLKKKKDQNDLRVKYSLALFCDENGISKSRWDLHLIVTKTRKKDITITLTMGRPGLFIGVGGETFDSVKEFLSERLGKPVIIKIVEFDPFRY